MKFATKKELATWLKERGIELLAPVSLSKGTYTFRPVLPPRVPGVGVRMVVRLMSGDVPVHSYEGNRWDNLAGAKMALTEVERAVMDTHVARLNEIQGIIHPTAHVYMRTV